jgi:hypothetical protein
LFKVVSGRKSRKMMRDLFQLKKGNTYKSGLKKRCALTDSPEKLIRQKNILITEAK